MVEQSVKIFKIADCSNSMKGSLVKKLRESAALVRAATTVMTLRAREVQGGNNNEELLKIIGELRAENSRLRKEIEEIKIRLSPPTSPPQTSQTREKRSSAAKKRRIVDSTDSEEEGRKLPPSLSSLADYPPLLQRVRKPEEGKERGAPQKERSLTNTGLTLEGATRQVDMHPPGLGDGDKAEHDALLAALTPVLENMSLQGNERGPEYRELWGQLNAIKGRLASLRGRSTSPLLHLPCPLHPSRIPPSGSGTNRSAPAGPSAGVLTLEQYVSPSVIDKEVEASRSQEGGTQLQREASTACSQVHGAGGKPEGEEEEEGR